MKEETKLGKITHFTIGFEDHGIFTANIQFEYEEGGTQSFGGYAIDETNWLSKMLGVTGKDNFGNIRGTILHVTIRDGLIKKLENPFIPHWMEQYKVFDIEKWAKEFEDGK